MRTPSPRRLSTWLCVSFAFSGVFSGCNCAKRSGSTGGLVANQGVLSPKPSVLNFGNVPVNQHAALQLQIINTGAGELDLESQKITGDTTNSFSAQAFPTTYAVHQSGTSVVTFAPTQAGPLSAELVLDNDGNPDVVDVELEGTGIAIDVSCTPSSMAFGPVQVGASPSPSQTFTCVNNGTTASLVSINAIDTDPQFSVTDSNGPVDSSNQQSIAPGASYVVTVTYAPASVAAVSSAFTYTLCANASTCVAPVQVPLTGNGVSGLLEITPNPIVYTGVPTGQTANQTITLTNIGANALTVSCIALDTLGPTSCGTASSAFSFSALPGTVTLSANQTATFTLTYTASSSTATTDQLDVTYTSAGVSTPSEATAPITAGSVTAPCSLTLSPSTIYFGFLSSANVGVPIAMSTTLTNAGTSVCNISGIAIDPASDPSYSLDSSQALSLAIAAGASATITADITLNNANTPNQRTGDIDFTSNDPNYANGQIALLASLETIGSTCPNDHPNLFTGQTDQGGTCSGANSCAPGLTCTNSACWLLGEQGPIQVALSWDYEQDLDLHVVEPQAGGPQTENIPGGGTQRGCEIYYGNGVEGSGGFFDDCTPVGELNQDAQAACSGDDINVEEVTYPSTKLAPAGWYTVRVDFWQSCQPEASVPYVVQVRIGNYLESYCGTFNTDQADEGDVGSGLTIFQFQMLADGGMGSVTPALQ